MPTTNEIAGLEAHAGQLERDADRLDKRIEDFYRKGVAFDTDRNVCIQQRWELVTAARKIRADIESLTK